MRGESVLEPKEKRSLETWRTRHRKRCKRRLKLVFKQTPIAPKIEVHCSCGKSKDITDYNTW